jgi:hypothetical protein
MRNLFAVLTAMLAVTAVSAAVLASPAAADYGQGALYQVEITANGSGPNGGGIWLWIELTPSAGSTTRGNGDYAGSDCGHGVGSASDKGEVTWSSSGGVLTISGVILNGLEGTPVTIQVPSTYGHYSYKTNAFTTIFSGLPPFVTGGFAQVQVAP